MMDSKSLKDKAKLLDNQKLKQLISSDCDDFEEGVYNIYYEEYISRNIDEEDINKEIQEVKLTTEENQLKKLIKVGYVFAILGGFLGILIGIMIMVSYKDNSDDKSYRTKHGARIIILSVGMWIIMKALFYIFSFL